MRYASVMACVSIIGLFATWPAPARSAGTCESTKLRAGALDLTLNSGDTSTVKVTGYRGPKAPATPAPDVVFHARSGVAYNLTAGDEKQPQTVVRIASNLTANIVVDPPSPASAGVPTPAPGTSATPQADSAKPQADASHPGGPDDKLDATMKDERYASFSASSAPASSSSAKGDDSASPSVDYTIKGQHPGDTKLIVTQGSECVAIGIHIRPPVSDRFLATAGVGMSIVPKYSIDTVNAPAAFSPVSDTVVKRALKTENSGHQVSIPLLFNYRVTDNAQSNLYGTVGFFTNSAGSGLVYGLSIGKEQYLLTLGAHSDNVTDLAPGLRNNDIVPSGITTSVTRRVTSGFLALTFPTSFLTQLLSPGSSAAKSGSGSSSTSGSSGATQSH